MNWSTCRTCGASIVWLKTAKGKSMPVDPEGIKLDDKVFEHGRHTSHFATCPDADTHRRDERDRRV